MKYQEDAMGTYEEGTPVSVIDVTKLPGLNEPPKPLPALAPKPEAALVVEAPAAAETAPPPVGSAETGHQLDLNELRRRLLDNQQRGEVAPGDPDKQLFTSSDGEILLGDQVNPEAAERYSVITQERFYAPDLNKIARTIRENQQQHVTDPSAVTRQMFTTPDGQIVMGDEVDPSSAERLSRITQERFYAPDSRRLALEQSIVGEKLPSNAYQASDGSITGWVYSITNEFADTYELFLWYDEGTATYKVSLIEPRLGGNVGVEDCHLYSDGTICLKKQGGSGYRNLADAYARSVLWTRGASCYRRGYGFQFNAGQEG
jgi:hypothetical protein